MQRCLPLSPSTLVVRTPELTLTSIEISFGKKVVELLINESRDTERTTEVSVDESLLDPAAQVRRELRLRRKN